MQPVVDYSEQVLQAETCIGPYRLVKRLRQGGMTAADNMPEAAQLPFS